MKKSQTLLQPAYLNFLAGNAEQDGYFINLNFQEYMSVIALSKIDQKAIRGFGERKAIMRNFN
jgi:hypothetical protein